MRETLDGEVESVPVPRGGGPNKASQLVAMCRERSASSQVDMLGSSLHLQSDFEPMPSFSLSAGRRIYTRLATSAATLRSLP